MILHHLKIALRNLRKYKTQNIISIIGLAVGFVCFAFSALWIRYEMSYDNFHPKIDRIYRVQMARLKWDTFGANASDITNPPFPIVEWLKSNFPDIEEAGRIRLFENNNYSFLEVDPFFCTIFDMDIPENFFIAGNAERPVIMVNDLKESVESVKEKLNRDVRMTVPRWPANTNLPFDFITPISQYTIETSKNWNTLSSSSYHTYILIKGGVNVQALKEKLDKVLLPEAYTPVSLIITPLKQLRYKDPSGTIQSDIKFGHIQIFALAGLLVILCSLFNHLTLYVTRVRMRLRELALRKVNGATNGQIVATLYFDFLLVILLSIILGFMLMAWLLPVFKEYARIGNNNLHNYVELLCYAVLLCLSGFFAGWVPVLYYRKQALNDSIKGFGSPGSGNLFRKACLLVQLIVSLGLMFCSAVFIKQMLFLHHTDLGINRRNIASVNAKCRQVPLTTESSNTSSPSGTRITPLVDYCTLWPFYADRIRQISGVTDVLPVSAGFLKEMTNSRSSVVQSNDDGTFETYTVYATVADARFFDFFGVEIIEGVGFTNEYNRKRVLNETAVKELGKALSDSEKNIGVARDFYLTPTLKPKPTEFYYPDPEINGFKEIAYKYEDGMRQQTEQAITQWLREEFSDEGGLEINFTYLEDVFEEHFKSERALLTLLSVMTLACILIAVFGVYSLAGLSCQQRRKEIAIRKINGAEVVDVMNIFFKEYLLMLAMAALVAFPLGYIIMKRWMEVYVKQTAIDAWLYVLISLIVFIVIVFTIVSMVWKAANQNPSEVVKTE